MTLRVSRLSLALLLLTLPSLGQATPSLVLNVASLSRDSAAERYTIVVGCQATPDAFSAAVPQLNTSANWRIYFRGSAIPVLHAAVAPRLELQTVSLDFDAKAPNLPDIGTLVKGELSVVYGEPGHTPLLAQNSRGLTPASASPGSGSLLSRLPTFTPDKKTADIDIAGSLQTAVDAKPLYFWSVDAAYPITLFGRYGTVAPTFVGQASQQENADPDSMKASAVYKKVISFQGTRQGLIVDGDLLGYEFERKAKSEAVLVNGVAVKQTYQHKNTSLIASGAIHYVTGLRRVNVTLSSGGEIGKALSRSVRTTGTTSDSDLQIRRLLLGADAYTVFFGKQSHKPRILFDAHYTLRLPFTSEPFTRASLNGGNEFLTSKPRHYLNLNGNIPLTDGVSLTLQGKHGSLPPTFEFVDNQVTIGFELFLRRR
ncbi:MAG: hypothetical protein NVSMB3_08790 [Acidobacteriaceae bacterium]